METAGDLPLSALRPSSALASLSDLPYDLIRPLCTLLSTSDIVHMLMTCKTLYAYKSDDAIWQEQCMRYGVSRAEDLGGGTFFRIYSGILHTYGPLLGLWASDQLFTGSIIEFRIDRARKAIVEIGRAHV